MPDRVSNAIVTARYYKALKQYSHQNVCFVASNLIFRTSNVHTDI
jgi:hypothetical protein